jgi:Mn-dependent DtxR family transcriptional regulator
MKKEEVSKRIENVINELEDLVDQLHYFYNGNEKEFRTHVLKKANIIEDTLREVSISKTEAHRRIAKRYEKHYSDKIKELDDMVNNIDDAVLSKKITKRYKKNIEENKQRDILKYDR